MTDLPSGRVPRPIPSAISYPEQLPVSERREDIKRALNKHQVLVVAGETGSGKTTQLPKICLEMGRGTLGRIGHTQPRRLAARTVAQRIASELNTELGSVVGYQVRFTDQVSDASAIKLMTDGILLSELQHDKNLSQYDTLIIDEAHERSLNIDFILGYLKQLLPRRPDLKVIITSATIDVERFSQHFDNAPVIEVSGRTFPVDVHYFGDIEDRDQGVTEQIASLVDDIESQRFGPRGDVLVFLPGEREIRDLSKRLKATEHRQILPLYARLSAAEQNKVFNPSGRGMRVILATNVAETSLTVPGIRYVIDPGDARISRYSHRTRLQRLPIESISQASANQRKGRCGRVAEGVCLRLYSEEDFNSRPEFTDPEIFRTNLAAVILRMLQLGIGEPGGFPFVDPPEPKMVRDGFKLLEELGAVSKRGKLTSTGHKMARLPVDPKLARMLLAAVNSQCIAELLVIVSAMAVQDPRERPAEKKAQSDQAHARFNHTKSDFMAWINLWRYYEEQRQSLSQSQLRKLCKKEFLSYLRMREWRDLHVQLTIACRQIGFKVSSALAEDENYEGIHKALLAGLLGQIAQQDEGRQFNVARNRKAQIFPGSSQYRKPPRWLVSGEIVETSQVFARQCAAIEPDWLLNVNPYLLKYHHYEPSWQLRSGRVMALERITLFGLTISDGKRVHFGTIDPKVAREIMIRDALVPGNFKSPPAFLKHNLRMIREVQDMESRVRRRDLLVDEEALFAFYDERLPSHVVSGSSLEKALTKTTDLASTLQLKRDQVLTRDPDAELTEQFPSTLTWAGVGYKLSYQFEPGKANDGVSVTVPLPLLNRAPRYRFDWLIPGLLREKCIALIKGLPKPLRKQLVPVPDVVDTLLEHITPDDRDLCAALSDVLKRQRNITVPVGEWGEERLEDFYRMNIRVVDERGKLLAQDRNMAHLVEQFRDDNQSAQASKSGMGFEQRPVSDWDFGVLPREWKSRAAGMEVLAYPALVVDKDQVSLTLLDYSGDAELAHRKGFATLALKRSSQTSKYLKKQLLSTNEAALALAGCGVDRSALVHEMIMTAFILTLEDAPAPRSDEEFEKCLANARTTWVPQALELERALVNFLLPVAQALNKLKAYPKAQFQDSRTDIQQQVQALLNTERLFHTPGRWLEYYPRYGKALLHRVERLSGQYAKDQKGMAMLAPFAAQLKEAREQRVGLEALCSEAQELFWMLEEFRISLFAQQLGTKIPVSSKRLEQQWSKVAAWMQENPR